MVLPIDKSIEYSKGGGEKVRCTVREVVEQFVDQVLKVDVTKENIRCPEEWIDYGLPYRTPDMSKDELAKYIDSNDSDDLNAFVGYQGNLNGRKAEYAIWKYLEKIPASTVQSSTKHSIFHSYKSLMWFKLTDQPSTQAELDFIVVFEQYKIIVLIEVKATVPKGEPPNKKPKLNPEWINQLENGEKLINGILKDMGIQEEGWQCVQVGAFPTASNRSQVNNK